MVWVPNRQLRAGTSFVHRFEIRKRPHIYLPQLALALARLFEGPVGHRDTSFHIADKQALTSLLTFILGASLGRIGDWMGPKSRAWLFLGTFIQALFTMTAALTAWKSGQGSVADDRGDPAWSNVLTFVALGFMSASLGLQGIMGKRVNTQFTTTSAFPINSPPARLTSFRFCGSCPDDRMV